MAFAYTKIVSLLQLIKDLWKEFPNSRPIMVSLFMGVAILYFGMQYVDAKNDSLSSYMEQIGTTIEEVKKHNQEQIDELKKQNQEMTKVIVRIDTSLKDISDSTKTINDRVWDIYQIRGLIDTIDSQKKRGRLQNRRRR